MVKGLAVSLQGNLTIITLKLGHEATSYAASVFQCQHSIMTAHLSLHRYVKVFAQNVVLNIQWKQS